MLNLAGLTPVAVCGPPDRLRLQWRLDGRLVETDFERFRPVGLVPLPDGTALRPKWRDFVDLPMSDLFFRATLDKAAALPGRAGDFQTDWDVVEDLAARPDNLPFRGAVFHMARAGSTLVHRLLSKTGKVASLAEVGIIDRALFLTERWPAERRNPVLRALVAAYARPRRPSERDLVIKMTDAMPNTRIRLFLEAFPELPWIFIYRDPVEVMVSMLRQPTGHIETWYKNRARVAERLSMPAVADGAMWPNEFIARSLRRFCGAVLEVAKDMPARRFLAVPYPRLPDAVWETIAPHFGIELSARDREIMQAEARYSAKRGDGVEFQPDSDRKRNEAGPRVRRLAEAYVAPILEEFKKLPQA